MLKPTFCIAYQPESRNWKLLKGDHTHPAIFAEKQQAISYAEFRCPPEGGVIRVRDEAGEIEEVLIAPHTDLHGYVTPE